MENMEKLENFYKNISEIYEQANSNIKSDNSLIFYRLCNFFNVDQREQITLEKAKKKIKIQLHPDQCIDKILRTLEITNDTTYDEILMNIKSNCEKLFQIIDTLIINEYPFDPIKYKESQKTKRSVLSRQRHAPPTGHTLTEQDWQDFMKPAFIPVVISPPPRLSHRYIKELEDPNNENYNADIILDKIFDNDEDREKFYYLTTQVKYSTIYNKFEQIKNFLIVDFQNWRRISQREQTYNEFAEWVKKEIEYFNMLNKNLNLEVKLTNDNQDMYHSIQRALESTRQFDIIIKENIAIIQDFMENVEENKQITTDEMLQRSEEENQIKRRSINSLIYSKLINPSYEFYNLIDKTTSDTTKPFSEFLIKRITKMISNSNNKKYIPIIRKIIERHILEISWQYYNKHGGWFWGWGDLINPLKIDLKRRYENNYGNPEFDFTSDFQQEIIHLGGNKNNNKHKSRKHKSRKHKSKRQKSIKYKFRKHKSRKYKSRKHKSRKHKFRK